MSGLLDPIDGLVSHADGYPVWARALFLATFALVVLSCAVYAVEFTRLRRRAPESPPARQP